MMKMNTPFYTHVTINEKGSEHRDDKVTRALDTYLRYLKGNPRVSTQTRVLMSFQKVCCVVSNISVRCEPTVCYATFWVYYTGIVVYLVWPRHVWYGPLSVLIASDMKRTIYFLIVKDFYSKRS